MSTIAVRGIVIKLLKNNGESELANKKNEYKKNSLVNFADSDQLSDIGAHYRFSKCIVQFFSLFLVAQWRP